MSVDASVVMRALDGVAPRTAISVSLASLTCGFTTVSVSVRFFRDADPASPHRDPFDPTRSYPTDGAEMSVRTDCPPTCAA